MVGVMRALFVRLFGSWTGFLEYLAIISACFSGLVGLAWWQGIFLPALLLTLLSWPRWAALVGKAARIDADWRELGGLAFRHGLDRWAARYFARAYMLPLVLGVKFGSDALHCAGAYVFGILSGWFWGLGPYGAA
jgi:hypothetical protein